MANVELTEEEVARRKAAAAKRKATREKNEALRAEAERKEQMDTLQAERERLMERLPKLREDYHSLLQRLGREKGFDRGKWNKLDQLQVSIMNTSERLRRINTDLENHGNAG